MPQTLSNKRAIILQKQRTLHGAGQHPDPRHDLKAQPIYKPGKLIGGYIV